jgi:tetratricopeptide (TPR) repeat protein
MLAKIFHKLGELLDPRGARAEISLQGRSRSLLFLLAVGFASLLFAAETSLTGIVFSFETRSVGRWLLALDSDDAWLHYRFGQVCKQIEPAEGVRQMRRAAQLSPESRVYWSNLASACESLGDTQCADQAWDRLLLLCPMVPLYHWHAAQSCLRSHRTGDAVLHFRRLLQLDPQYASDVWFSLQTLLDPDSVFQKVAADSPNSELKVGYVDFLSAQGNNDAAYRIWNRATANPAFFPLSAAQHYLERLIDRGRFEEAVKVWQDLERLAIVHRSEADENDNLIFNSDFEQFPLNAGFDWRWSGQLNYLAVDFSAPGGYHGAHCLRIDFAVSRNQEYEPVYQIVPVLAGHTYLLEAYVRSEDITSDTGPRLRVTDTHQPSFRDAVSETTVGTTPWHPVRVYFPTGPKTQAVRLSVWRPRGRVFPTEISGSFWLDAVTLEVVDPEGGGKSQEPEAKILKGKG